jgi:parallel beta-helix repeat protein
VPRPGAWKGSSSVRVRTRNARVAGCPRAPQPVLGVRVRPCGRAGRRHGRAGRLGELHHLRRHPLLLGVERAYRTLAGAAAAVAGDTVYLRGTTRAASPPAPAALGPSPSPPTRQAPPSPAYQPALWLVSAHIVVDGLAVSNVGGWGRLEDAAYNTIRNCTFTVATIEGTTGGLKLVRSTYNKILDNTFDDGNDNITVQESDRNVFQGNTISTGRHSLLSLRCGNYNVVRANTFSNPDQKDLEIYDCEGTSDAPVKLDATKRNLVEDNVIADTRSSDASHDYNGIQFAGQQGIVRRNVFRDDLGGGINFQYYSDESLYNNRNRVYHNTFYNNRCYGIVGDTGDTSRYYDNRARNNILYKNTSCSGGATQTSIPNPSLVILSDNAILTTSPGFVDEAARDLHLAPGSPMIDAAAFLTTATAAGSGTQITVADASYFFDGYGIPGELGDVIQLQGQTTLARVLAVDLAANRLTLDRSLSWTAGQGVTLRFTGAKPDLGAFETGLGPGPSISVNDITLGEGDSGTSTATFTVTLSAASTDTVTVTYTTADGTASTGADFVPTTGTIVFPAGSTTQTLEVRVIGDRVFESAETFTVGLSGAVNAVIADAQGRGTILDDDPAGLSIDDITIVEPDSGSRTARFTVTLSPTSGSPVTVAYSTAAGTATAKSDYDDTSGTLTFAPGAATRTVDVVVHADGVAEGVETFAVNLANASGAAIAYGQAIGSIHDRGPGNYFTLVPCRVLDTRNPAGPFGGPALTAGQSRIVSLANACGIPPTAIAVSLNLTVAQPTAAGNLRLYPADAPLPNVSSLNYAAGQTRANNGVAGLSPTGTLAIRCTQPSGTAHVIVDVSGYFE